MASLDTFFAPPDSVRGMKVLDRAAFSREISLPSVCVPASLCSDFLKRFKHVVLSYPNIKRIRHVEDRDGKVSFEISSPLCRGLRSTAGSPGSFLQRICGGKRTSP